ncbi:tyrosine-type recombinase/integrase [Candidatus Latescibacterota bacterium]
MGVYKRKLKKGIRWYFSGQFQGEKYFSKAIFLTKAECQKAERTRINELEVQSSSVSDDIMLIDLINERLDQIKIKRSYNYYRQNAWFFKMLLKQVGDIQISKITRHEINDFLNNFSIDLKQRGKTQHQVNAMLRNLKALFSWGIKIYDLNIKNPCSGLDYFPIEIKLKYIPPEEEIDAVKNVLVDYQVFLIDFVDQTACRVNEAIRFRYEDIDGELITLWTHKAKNSNLTPRRIPKPPCLNGKKGKGRVFPQWSDYPQFLGLTVSKLGFKHWGFHNLRHRRASIWASQNMPIYEIMQRLGHTNMSTTMKYLQLLGYTRR